MDRRRLTFGDGCRQGWGMGGLQVQEHTPSSAWPTKSFTRHGTPGVCVPPTRAGVGICRTGPGAVLPVDAARDFPTPKKGEFGPGQHLRTDMCRARGRSVNTLRRGAQRTAFRLGSIQGPPGCLSGQHLERQGSPAAAHPRAPVMVVACARPTDDRQGAHEPQGVCLSAASGVPATPHPRPGGSNWYSAPAENPPKPLAKRLDMLRTTDG